MQQLRQFPISNDLNRTALYVHIPFCHKLCPYCAFSKSLWKEDLETAYLKAIAQEIQSYKDHFPKLKLSSIFLGGGTPNALRPQNLASLLDLIITQFKVSPTIEKTIELNPESLTYSHLQVLKEHQINRVSLGVQSFVPEELKFLGRTHHPDRIKQVVQMLAKYDLINFNIDLIYGLPISTQESLSHSLKEALSLDPPHLSTYALSIESGTPFKRKKIATLPNDIAQTHYQFIKKTLKKSRYHHYEVSAFAKKGAQCRHNLAYWKLKAFIGLGPSGASYFQGRHYHNTSTLERYIQNPTPPLFKTPLPPLLSHIDRQKDYILANLRRSAGIGLSAFQKEFGIHFDITYAHKLAPLFTQKLLTQTQTHIKTTAKGQALLDSVLLELI